MQADVSAAGQDELVECDGELVRGREVLVQCVERSRSARNPSNGRDTASCQRANGNDEMVKDIDGLHDAPRDRFTRFSDPYFLVEGDLQGRAVGDCHCDGAVSYTHLTL